MISLFTKITNLYPYANCPLETVFNVIKTKEIEGVVLYRKTRDYNVKRNLPCYTVSGTFNKRCLSGLTSYNGKIVIDIDYKDQNPKRYDNLIERFKGWKYVWAYHKSCSGDGYAFYFQTENRNPDLHKMYFEALVETIEKTGLVVDKGCSDFSRLRYVSMDKNLTINKNFTYWSKFNEPKRRDKNDSWISASKRNEFSSRASRLLSYAVELKINLCPDYETWKRMGFAIANEFGEGGREAFHKICEISEKYNEVDTDKLYTAGMKKGSLDTGKTVATIFEILKKNDIRW